MATSEGIWRVKSSISLLAADRWTCTHTHTHHRTSFPINSTLKSWQFFLSSVAESYCTGWFGKVWFCLKSIMTRLWLILLQTLFFILNMLNTGHYFLKKDILCSFTRSQFYFGLLFIYFYMLKCSKYTSGFFYCLSLQHCICLCHERSVLAPVSLRPPPPHILYALIGQLTHAWASTAHRVSSLSSLELVFSFQLASCLLLKYRRWPRKCLTWWRRVMSISHRVKGSTTGINPNPNPLYGREELSSVHTLGFFTFKTFYPHKNLQFVTHWKNKIPS